MAFNPAPTSAFGASYTSNGTTLTLTIAEIEGLQTADCDATTGDWRAIWLALCDHIYKHYTGLATADRPTALVVQPPSQVAQNSGAFAGTIRTSYATYFYAALGAPEMADEPA